MYWLLADSNWKCISRIYQVNPSRSAFRKELGLLPSMADKLPPSCLFQPFLRYKLKAHTLTRKSRRSPNGLSKPIIDHHSSLFSSKVTGRDRILLRLKTSIILQAEPQLPHTSNHFNYWPALLQPIIQRFSTRKCFKG
jgi:hypothetical protein